MRLNNTYLLYKRGWTGTNIDLNPTSIDMFNMVRKKDHNICSLISDKEGEKKVEPVSDITKQVEDAVKKLPEIEKVKKEDIDILIPHQANLRIVEGLEKMLSLPNATTIKKVHKYGNTSAASIPTALVDALEEGEIKGGEVAVFTAVGAGLSWGACALRLGKRTTPINTSDAKLPDFDGKAVDTIRRAIEYQIPEKLDLI